LPSFLQAVNRNKNKNIISLSRISSQLINGMIMNGFADNAKKKGAVQKSTAP